MSRINPRTPRCKQAYLLDERFRSAEEWFRRNPGKTRFIRPTSAAEEWVFGSKGWITVYLVVTPSPNRRGFYAHGFSKQYPFFVSVG